MQLVGRSHTHLAFANVAGSKDRPARVRLSSYIYKQVEQSLPMNFPPIRLARWSGPIPSKRPFIWFDRITSGSRQVG